MVLVGSFISKLGKNDTEVQNIMDKMWEKYGQIFEFPCLVVWGDFSCLNRVTMIAEDLEKEIEYEEGKCLQNESCWSSVERNLRSLHALSNVAQYSI